MTKRTDFPNDLDSEESPIDTPGGMTDPASDEGRSADGADMASTDMNPGPSDRKSTRLNSSHMVQSRMPSSA